VTVPSFTVDSSTQITAQLVLAGTTGSRNLTVTTASGTSNTAAFSINSSVLTNAAGGDVQSFAGGGGAGFADAHGRAARFDEPSRVWSDGTNLYVTDLRNSVIRKVVIATGAVTTLAGKAGNSGNANGIGPAARFTRPAGIWGDGSGNLYVSDSSRHTIRKIVIASGEVTTVAGTGFTGQTNATGTSASFTSPAGLWGDGTYLYIADTSNHLIRRMELAGAVVTTFAGSADVFGTTDGVGTNAQFKGPQSIVGDSNYLYVSDQTNHLIRKINYSGVSGTIGEVSTLAGTAGLTGSTDGTGTSAKFAFPAGIGIDGSGNLYVADRNNHAIRKIVISSGVVTTPFGTTGSLGFTDSTGSAARFRVPADVFSDGTNLYVADSGNDAVRNVVISTGVVATFAGGPGGNGAVDATGPLARFYDPHSIWGDSAGNLYVVDNRNHTIRKINISTQAVTTLAGLAGTAGSTDGTGSAARFDRPTGIWGDGVNLYVSDGTHVIRKIVIATGVVTTVVGTPGSSGVNDGTGASVQFNVPSGLWGDGRYLYISDQNNHTIRRMDLETNGVSTFAGAPLQSGSVDGASGTARFDEPSGLWGDGTYLYVADRDNQAIRKIELSSGTVSTLAGTPQIQDSVDGVGPAARFNHPQSIWGDGTFLYVADSFNSTIRQINLSSGAVTTLAGIAGEDTLFDGPALEAKFDWVYGIWGDGVNLYVSEINNQMIRKFVPQPSG